MAFTRTITAANSIYLFTIPGVYDQPQQLQGYSTDAAFETAASEAIEAMKGVDGRMSSGFVPFMTEQTINLQADSVSNQIFEDWWNAQKQAREVFPCSALITLPSLKRKYTCTNGVLRSYTSIPGSRKTLQPRPAVILWDNIDPANS